MIRLKVKIKSSNGETYTNNEELHNEFVLSVDNPEFKKIIERNIHNAHFELVESVDATAYFKDL